MACSAHDERLASAHRHQFHPIWFLPPSWLSKVCQFADVVHLDGATDTTQFTASGQQPPDHFILTCREDGRRLVNEGCCLLPLQRNAPELRDQWCLASTPDDRDADARPASSSGLSCRFVLPSHLLDTRTMLTG